MDVVAMQPGGSIRKSAPLFAWDDPFLLEDQLSEDERLIRDTTRDFTQVRLRPGIADAYASETTDRSLFKARGDLGFLGVARQARRQQDHQQVSCDAPRAEPGDGEHLRRHQQHSRVDPRTGRDRPLRARPAGARRRRLQFEFITTQSAELGAHWMARYIEGTLARPPKDADMRKASDQVAIWKAEKRKVATTFGGLCIAPYHHFHFDQLMADIGARRKRWNVFAADLAPIRPKVYGKLLATAPRTTMKERV